MPESEAINAATTQELSAHMQFFHKIVCTCVYVGGYFSNENKDVIGNKQSGLK